MRLDLNRMAEKIEQNEFVKNFIKELSNALENLNNKNSVGLKCEKMDNIKLTEEEELEFDRREFRFLQDYFEKELLNSSKGEIYIVTNKYENDNEYHRYKVAQYKNNLECKYLAFEKDLPENVQLGDVVRKIDAKYIYDRRATQYVKSYINKIKRDIINNRDEET